MLSVMPRDLRPDLAVLRAHLLNLAALVAHFFSAASTVGDEAVDDLRPRELTIRGERNDEM